MTRALAHIEQVCTEMPDNPKSQGGSRDQAGEEEAHQEERPRLFWTGVEGWLRQRVSDGKDNYCSKVMVAPTVLSCKVYVVSYFMNKSLKHLCMHVFTAETLNE
jgi:hypothetical protein